MGSSLQDPIALVEAAYRLQGDEYQWLAGVYEEADRLLPSDLRTMCAIFETTDTLELRHLCSDNEEYDSKYVAGASEIIEEYPHWAALYRGTGLTTLSNVLGAPPRSVSEFDDWAPAEVVDYLGIVAPDPSGLAIQVGAVSRRLLDPPARHLAIWDRLCTHIATGFRLQRRYAEIIPDSADATLNPDGTLAHAASAHTKSTEWRALLRDATVNLETARRRFRKDDDLAALDLWKGLVRGTYSLVEYFDTDGRRFYIAQENEPDDSGPRGLSRRERQVVAHAGLGLDNRQIAYRLGLAESTIATYLRRAIEKLGVDSRASLIQLVGQLGPDKEHIDDV